MGDFFQGPPPSQSRRSFTSFYKANISTVVRILGRIGVHPADIPDIAQQVFEKIYKKWDELGSDGPEVSLDTICRQQAANHYRLYRHRFEQPEPSVGEDMPSGDEDAQAQLEHHELDQIVQRILDGMTPEFRDLLIRREFQKESLESIAEAHNIARNTATARIAEARKIFRSRAERLLGDKRSWLLFVPWMIRAHEFNTEYSEEFLADVQDQVWRGLVRELGFSDEDATEYVVREADHEPPSNSHRRTITAVLPWSKPLLGALTKPVFLLGAGVLGGIAVASLWPHASPAIARRMPSLPVVVLEHETVKELAGTVMPSIQSAVVQPAPSKASLAPLIDIDLRILQRARTLITQGSYAEALAALRQHDKDFPQSEHRAIRGQYIALAEEGLRRVRASTSAPQHF